MSRRLVTLGLAVLCAMALGGLLASGILAAPTESNTAFTCVEVGAGTGEFSNAHCSSKEGTPKNWKHNEINEGEETQLTLAAIGEQELKTKVGIPIVIVKAAGLECVGCMVHNQKEAGGAMDLTGEGGHLRYTGATINIASCKVVGGEYVTEPLRFTSETSTLVSFVPIAQPWAIVKLEPSVPGQPCVLGAELRVTGHANATAKGATLKFNTGAGELLVGAQIAELKGEVTMSGGLTGGTHRPIALTPTP